MYAFSNNFNLDLYDPKYKADQEENHRVLFCMFFFGMLKVIKIKFKIELNHYSFDLIFFL